jgi:V-type H+-transporting ATPase subunit a
MMSLFSMYSGLLYNDFFALPLNLFGSRYKYPGCQNGNGTDICQALLKMSGSSNLVDVFAADVSSGKNVYPFGLDPIWMSTSNELLFVNSFKMKLSVIVGISIMIFGIVLKGMNQIYYRDWNTFFFEFLPQFVFACSFFFYMIVLIVYKWCIDWTARMKFETCPYDLLNDGSHLGCRPPSLINTLINIVLSPGKLDEPLFPHQKQVQTVLLLLALISIPWMLIIKPIIIKVQHSKMEKALPVVESAVDEEAEEEAARARAHGAKKEEFDMSEVIIGQAIETIEFILGMVSNTASYLRLWALSLAHTELASVFWEKAMLSTINMNSFIAIFCGYAVYAAITFGVILAMDCLECYLHALRLQWVEFQNKFFMADGHRFYPLSFHEIILEARLADD